MQAWPVCRVGAGTLAVGQPVGPGNLSKPGIYCMGFF